MQDSCIILGPQPITLYYIILNLSFIQYDAICTVYNSQMFVYNFYVYTIL